MGGIVKRYRFENKGRQFRRRCDYCHTPRQELYRAQFEQNGPYYWLCPLNCFNNAQTRYQENLKKNPVILGTKQELPENEIIEASKEGEAAITEI